MPSIEFHVSRSLTREDVAREIHNWLDNPGGTWLGIEAHVLWRLRTHDPKVAGMLGMIIAMVNGEDPLKGFVDGLKHVLDDQLFNRLIRWSDEGNEG